MALTYKQPSIDYFDRQHRDMVTRIYERSLVIKHCGSGLVPSYLSLRRYKTPPTTHSRYDDIEDLTKKSTALIAAKTARTFRTMKRICPNDVIERAKRECELDDEDMRDLAHREYLIYKNRRDKEEGYNFSDNVKHLLRGQSPSTISSVLLANSNRNLRLAKKEEELFTRQAIRSLCSDILDRKTFRRHVYVPPVTIYLRPRY